MKVISHYPEEGDVREDPNLRSLLEHSDMLLSEEYLFESPFKDVIRSISDVNPNDFNLNVDDIGLEDDFDLSDDLTEFVGKIRELDKGKCESGNKIGYQDISTMMFVAMVPLILLLLPWFLGLALQKDANYCTTLRNDWLLIIFGIILTLALITTLIVLAYHIRKKNELEHEDSRLFFEHQNKMINEYASYLYSIKRVRIQQCETLLSLKQQYALQQMDFQQREMDMRQKEQDNAWKHLGDHQNAVREHLSNLHYEANPDMKTDDKEETHNKEEITKN